MVALGYLRNDRAAEAVAEELSEAGAERDLVRGNVSSTRVADEVAALGPLDALVHNAATGVIRPALETEDKHWDWTLRRMPARSCRSPGRPRPQMPNGASIVGISSLGSVRVLEDYVLVGTSKAALEALVRYLAVELAPRGIRVNAVSGGVVDTDALDHFPNGTRCSRWAEANARGPDGRAERHRRRRPLPLLAGRRDDPRPGARRRRRLLAAGREMLCIHAEKAMRFAARGPPCQRLTARPSGATGVPSLIDGTSDEEPVGRDEVDRRRAEVMRGQLGLPGCRVRMAPGDLRGRRVLGPGVCDGRVDGELPSWCPRHRRRHPARRSTSRASAGPTPRGCRPTCWTSPRS